MLRYKLICVALVALSAINANCEVLTPEQALNRVVAAPKTNVLKSSRTSVYSLKKSFKISDQPTVYVMENKEGRNLVLSADDQAETLLGYFTQAPGEELPPAMIAWLDDYSNQIAAARQSNVRLEKVLVNGAHNVSPLLETLWNQDEPFNNLCPRYVNESSGVDKRCPSGCVATAMAQVVNYHRYPEHGIGTHSYSVNGWDLSFDYGSATFDYDNMARYYGNGGYTQAQADAVATLMYACGIGVEAIYSPYSTGAMSENIAPALVNFFGYDRGTRIVKRRFFPLQQWNEMMYNEVAAGRPVCYAGGNAEGAHQFVIDGYDTDGYFHVNWGWGTISNGYFLITGLDPDNQGIGGSTGGFNVNQSAIIGAQPPVNPDKAPDPLMALQFDWGPQPQTIVRSTTQMKMFSFSPNASIDGGWENYCCEDQELLPGVKFTDSNGNVYYEWSQMGSKTFPTGKYTTYQLILYGDKKTSTNHITVPNGVYKATPVVKTVPEEGSDQEPQIFDAIVGLGFRQYVNVTITDTELVFSNPPSPSKSASATAIEVASPLYSGKLGMLKSTITAGSAEYYGYVNVVMVKYMEDSNVTTLGQTFMSAIPGDQAEFTWQGNISVEPGYYYLKLTDDNGNHITGKYVTVSEAPTATPEVNITDINVVNSISGSGTFYDPCVVKGKDLKLSYTINCTAGYFVNQVYCNIMEGYSSFYNTLMPQNFIDEGASNTQALNINLEKAEYDNIYTVRIKQRYTSASGYTTDQYITGGTTYFRFVEPDVTAIDQVDADNDGVNYDPVSRMLYAPQSTKEIWIVDLTGRIVEKANANFMDCTSIAPGIYIVAIHSANSINRLKIHL